MHLLEIVVADSRLYYSDPASVAVTGYQAVHQHLIVKAVGGGRNYCHPMNPKTLLKLLVVSKGSIRWSKLGIWYGRDAVVEQVHVTVDATGGEF
ncbi:hypothetical protein D3C81_1073080 [compost metagenome]